MWMDLLLVTQASGCRLIHNHNSDWNFGFMHNLEITLEKLGLSGVGLTLTRDLGFKHLVVNNLAEAWALGGIYFD